MDGTEFSTAFDPIEVGNLVARLAVNDAEIGAAQSLRYRVFYEEMSAHPSAEVEAAKRDFDRFDAICACSSLIEQESSMTNSTSASLGGNQVKSSLTDPALVAKAST